MRANYKRFLTWIACMFLGLVLLSRTSCAIGSYNVNLGSNAYQSTVNPFYIYRGDASNGSGGQCTWYAWGRAYEKLGVSLPCRGNAKNWTSEAANAGWSTGTEARANSIMVEDDGSTYGHVFFVEKVENGYAYVTEGNFVPHGSSIGQYHEDLINLSTMRRESWKSHQMGSITYIYLSGGSNVNVAFSVWENSNYTYVNDTDAAVGEEITVTGGTGTDSGMYLYSSNGTELGHANNNSFYYRVYFKAKEELGVTLTSATVYKYKFFAVVNGKTYWGPERSFTTKGVRITKQPANSTVTAGDKYSYSLNAAGSGLTYTWYYKRSGASSFTASSVTSSTFSGTADLNDNGMQVYCVVKDNAGYTAKSSTVALTVKPRVTAQLENCRVRAGETFSFKVSATGEGLSYTWYYKLKGSSSFTSATGSAVAFTGAADVSKNGMQVYCVVKDGSGHTAQSNTATLTVLPAITVQPSACSVAVGERYSFSVVAKGDGISYDWYYAYGDADSLELLTSFWETEFFDFFTKTNVHSSTYSGTAGDREMFVGCIVTDTNGFICLSSLVPLIVKPKVSAQPKDQSVAAGSTANFKVSASGIAPLTYQWQSKSPSSNEWKNSVSASAKTDTLEFSAQGGHNGYQFRCVISSGKGEQLISNAATLTVNAKIKTQPKNVEVTLGSDAKFSISVEGASPLRYQWQSKAPSSSSWKNSLAASATTANLTFSTQVAHSGYQFRCVVIDGNGREIISDIATLKVKPCITTQPQNTNAKVGSTAPFTVTVKGKANITYQWQAKAPDSVEWINSGATGAKTANLSVLVLAAHNGYQFRCVVTDGNGNKTISSSARLTVDPKIVTQPKNATAEVGSVVNYKIVVTGAGPFKYQWQSMNPTTGTWKNSLSSSAKTESFSFAAQPGHIGFLFRCIVTDGNGKELYSNPVMITLKPGVVVQPKSITVPVGGSASFSVAAKGAGTLKYQWQAYNPNTKQWVNSSSASAKTSTLSITAQTGHHGFKFRCIVTDGNGNSTTTSAVQLTVRPGIVTQPKDVTVSVGGTVKLTVSAKSVGTLSYQWQVWDTATETWKNSLAASAKTVNFTFTAQKGHNGKKFRCVLTDSNGNQTVTRGALVTVK